MLLARLNKNGEDECYMKVEQAHAILLQNRCERDFFGDEV
jgi:hypothetical protein